MSENTNSNKDTPCSAFLNIIKDIFSCSLKSYNICCYETELNINGCTYNHKPLLPVSPVDPCPVRLCGCCTGILSLTILSCISPCKSCLSVK
jgi:hypothetical protein